MTIATGTGMKPIQQMAPKISLNNINLIPVFASGGNINIQPLFFAHFNTIPNVICENDIDCKRANLWFDQHYRAEIKNKYFNKRQFDGSKKAELDDIYYFLFDDLLVHFDTKMSDVTFLFFNTEESKVESAISEIQKFKIKKRKQHKAYISLLIASNEGFSTTTIEFAKPKISITENYNDDFIDIHKTIGSSPIFVRWILLFSLIAYICSNLLTY